MRKLKPFLGILLILLSIGGLLFWELKGREAILMEEILVAKEDIQKGEMVNADMFFSKGIPKDNMLEEALTPEKISKLQDKISSQLILKNDQITMDYFKDNDFYLNKDDSIFVIDPEWISMRSSSLRRGDIIDIYSNNGWGLIGTFKIAYVKDASEREVRNAGEENQAHDETEILKRTDSTSVIDHIEIISTISEYEAIVNCVYGPTPTALIIVQRGDKIDT